MYYLIFLGCLLLNSFVSASAEKSIKDLMQELKQEKDGAKRWKIEEELNKRYPYTKEDVTVLIGELDVGLAPVAQKILPRTRVSCNYKMQII